MAMTQIWSVRFLSCKNRSEVPFKIQISRERRNQSIVPPLLRSLFDSSLEYVFRFFLYMDIRFAQQLLQRFRIVVKDRIPPDKVIQICQFFDIFGIFTGQKIIMQSLSVTLFIPWNL